MKLFTTTNFLVAVFLVLLLPTPLLAADGFLKGFELVDKIRGEAGVGEAKDGGSVIDLVFKIVNVLLSLVGVIAVVVLIIGGFMYILSFGDEKKIERAKHIILYAIVGLIVIGVSAIAVNFIIETVFAPKSLTPA